MATVKPVSVYADIRAFVADTDIVSLLCLDTDSADLLKAYTDDGFLTLDETIRVPFFAETRGYVGAREAGNADATWIAKPVQGDEIAQSLTGMVAFFLDFRTQTPSAPTIVSWIDGKPYRASKIMRRTEQLSGANYMELAELREQLQLDLVNRWIYCDEDRNPNNYMIRYNSANHQIVIPIDFSNVDLRTKGIKIKGRPRDFGWERSEKTRYLTPLKPESFEECDLDFFEVRLAPFRKLKEPSLRTLAGRVFRRLDDGKEQAAVVAANIVERVAYLDKYFKSVLPQSRGPKEKKYGEMGNTFNRMYEGPKR
jgi:hypothetical protein